MTKTCKKTLATLVLTLFAGLIGVFGAVTLKSAHASEPIVEQEAALPNGAQVQTLQEITTHTGIGLGINVIDAQSIDEFKTGSSILDSAALKQMLVTRINYQKNNIFGYSSINTRELIDNFGTSMELGVSADVFLANLAIGMKTGISTSYSNYNYKYYYTYVHDIYKYNLYLNNYLEPSTYSDIYSSYYLADLKKLQDNTITYENFFDKYGTHIIGSAIYGGKLRENYTATSNLYKFDAALQAKMDEAISFPLTVNTPAAVNSAIAAYYNVDRSKLDVHTYFNSVAVGGDAFSTNNVLVSNNATEKWAESFNEETEENPKSVLVDYTKQGLVALWDILPAEYSDLAVGMNAEFQRLCKIKESVLDEFKPGDYTNFSGGMGTEKDPYLISNAQELRNIESVDMSANYKLIKDIDLKGIEWTPIGGFYLEKAFSGYFYGANHKIKNLTRTEDIPEKKIKTTDQYKMSFFGLFGYVTGTVKSIHFQDMNVSIKGPSTSSGNRNFIGVVAGKLEGGRINYITLESGTFTYNCCTPGKVYMGGIVGLTKHAGISYIENQADLTAGRYAATLGGVAGFSDDTLYDRCNNKGTLTAIGTRWFGHSNVGGIVGSLRQKTDLTFRNCGNFGNLYANGYSTGPSIETFVGLYYAEMEDIEF